jgi:hypothetical protein
MDTKNRLKNAPSNHFNFPEPAQLNVLADAEPKSPKPTKQALRKPKAADQICYPRRSPRNLLNNESHCDCGAAVFI